MQKDYTLSKARMLISEHLGQADQECYLPSLEILMSGVEKAEREAAKSADVRLSEADTALRRFRSQLVWDRSVMARVAVVGAFLAAASMWGLIADGLIGLFGFLFFVAGVGGMCLSKPGRRDEILKSHRREHLLGALAVIAHSEAELAKVLLHDLDLDGSRA